MIFLNFQKNSDLKHCFNDSLASFLWDSKYYGERPPNPAYVLMWPPPPAEDLLPSRKQNVTVYCFGYCNPPPNGNQAVGKLFCPPPNTNQAVGKLFYPPPQHKFGSRQYPTLPREKRRFCAHEKPEFFSKKPEFSGENN